MDIAWMLVLLIRQALPSDDANWAARLTVLDSARVAAWARGDASALGQVYEVGSPVWKADRRLLRAYAKRGASVRGGALRVLDAHVQRRAPGVVALRVVDVLGPASVVWPDGSTQALPHDRPTARTITLRNGPDGWRIAGSVQR
jgi:hypothetical protein